MPTKRAINRIPPQVSRRGRIHVGQDTGFRPSKGLKRTKSTPKRFDKCSFNGSCQREGEFKPVKCGVNHKICSEHWWNNFALEGGSHPCPACKRNPSKLKSLGARIEDAIEL
jgi:hypothetical protein